MFTQIVEMEQKNKINKWANDTMRQNRRANSMAKNIGKD